MAEYGPVVTMVEIERIFRRPPVTEPEHGRLYRTSDLYSPDPFPRCRGIYVGGCIQNDRRDGESAHAHIHPDANTGTSNLGIICVWEPHTLWFWEGDIDWAPKYIMWHEYAHVLEPDDGTWHDHSPVSPWGRLMIRWGLEASRVS